MKSHTSSSLSNSSSSKQENIISYLNRCDSTQFKVSASKIRSPQKGLLRGKKEAALEKLLMTFEDMLRKRRQLPADESFARVLTVLRKLDRADEAIEIFDIISQKFHSINTRSVIGAWTYTALLEIFERQIKQAKEDKAKQADIVAKAQGIWQVCEQRGLIDSYSATSMMGIYKEADKFQDAIDIFNTYKRCADLDMYSKCINILIWLKKIDKALSLLEKMKQKFKSISNKKRRDYGNMRIVYNLLIISIFKYEENLNHALQLFEDGTKLGIYQTNQMQEDNQAGMVSLNFHLSKDHRNEEGGLSLAVSKVAFLYFMQQVKNNEIHLPAKLITGGHIEGQDKLKQELPKYLQDEYGVEINWNPEPKILEFVIPYASLRKIRFINDVRAYMNTQQDLLPAAETAYRELKRRYRADLRRDNENRSDKYFSEKLAIPVEYEGEVKKVAEDSMNSYDQKKYKEAEQQYRKLIDLSSKHPWAYAQLGWILHRTDRFDEAINEYNKGKELNQADSDDAKKLQSEIYRRIGWAYDRKHRQSKSAEHLNTAFENYEQALKFNSTNYEVYNNWGIGLYRNKQYEEAIQKLETVKQNKPEHDEVCVHLGDCYGKLRQFEQAEKSYKDAIERSKQFDEGRSAAWAYCNLGKLYLQRYEKYLSDELFNSAQNAFKRCLKLQPGRDQAHKGLAKLHGIKGNNEQALENSKNAEDIMPDLKALINKGRKGTEASSSISEFFAPRISTHVEAVSKSEGLVP